MRRGGDMEGGMLGGRDNNGGSGGGGSEELENGKMVLKLLLHAMRVT